MEALEGFWRLFRPVLPGEVNCLWRETATKRFIMQHICGDWKLYIYTHRMSLFVD